MEDGATTDAGALDLGALQVDPRLWHVLPPSLARRAHAVPVVQVGATLEVAVASAHADLGELGERLPGLDVHVHRAPPEQVDALVAAAPDAPPGALGPEGAVRLAALAGLEAVALRAEGEPEPGDGRRVVRVSPLAAGVLDARTARGLDAICVAVAGGTAVVATSTPALCPPALAAAAVVPTLGEVGVEVVVAPSDELAAVRARHPPARAPTGDEAAVAGPTAVTRPRYPTRLGDLLVAQGRATDAQVAAALEEQRRTGARLGEALLAAGVVDEPALVRVLAEHLGLPIVDVGGFEPDEHAAAALPEAVVRRLRVLPIAVDETTLYLAVADALDEVTRTTLQEHTSLELRGFLAPASDIDAAIARRVAAADDPDPAPAPEPEPQPEPAPEPPPAPEPLPAAPEPEPAPAPAAPAPVRVRLPLGVHVALALHVLAMVAVAVLLLVT